MSPWNVEEMCTLTRFYSLIVCHFSVRGFLGRQALFFVGHARDYPLFSPWILPSYTKIRVRGSGYTLPLQIQNEINTMMRVAL